MAKTNMMLARLYQPTNSSNRQDRTEHVLLVQVTVGALGPEAPRKQEKDPGERFYV